MNSIDKLFQANSGPLIGKDSPFVIDKHTSVGPAFYVGGPTFYLKDKNSNIVGFTHEGKHVFLQNVQKDKSGALFITAQYKMPTQDIDNIINGYFIYLNNSGKHVAGSENHEFFKNGKHVFAQVKDKKNTFINKFKKKKPEMRGLEGKRLKFKELHPFVDLQEDKSKINTRKSKDKGRVNDISQEDLEDKGFHPSVDLQEPKSKIKTKKSKDKSKISPLVDLQEPKSKIKTKKSQDKDRVYEITQEDLENIETEKKNSKKTKKRS